MSRIGGSSLRSTFAGGRSFAIPPRVFPKVPMQHKQNPYIDCFELKWRNKKWQMGLDSNGGFWRQQMADIFGSGFWGNLRFGVFS